MGEDSPVILPGNANLPIGLAKTARCGGEIGVPGLLQIMVGARSLPSSLAPQTQGARGVDF
jgi:hypothetical protein